MPRALVSWGGWEGHQPEAFAKMAAGRLLDGFDVELTDDPAVFAEAPGRRYDVILPIWTQGELSADQEHGLVSAVEAGAGLVAWHGAADAFRASAAFRWLLGGMFVAHPGDFVPYRVEFTRSGHPLADGLDGFGITSEQYYMLVDPGVEVFAETVFPGSAPPWIAGTRMPVAWTRRWGRGRVFYHAIGHAPREFDIPQVFEMTRRGIEWAARREASVS